MQDSFGDRESTLQLYFDDIADSKPLSRQREVALSARIQDGDLEARDELVQANLFFAIDVAKNYQNRGLPLADLSSAGNVGLMTAADRFDGTKGFKFISYAVWWIKQSILQTIADHARTVRLPMNRVSLLNDISKTSRRLGQGREANPDIEEIAAELEIPAEEVLRTILSARAVRSLDESFEENDERNLLNTLADTTQAHPDADVLRESAKDQLESVLNSLNQRELRIIRLYYGLDGEALNLEQIGGLMGVTRERVRQIKERALSRLRHPSRHQFLRALADEVGVAPEQGEH